LHEEIGSIYIVLPAEGGIFLAGIYEGHGGTVDDGVGLRPRQERSYLRTIGQVSRPIGEVRYRSFSSTRKKNLIRRALPESFGHMIAHQPPAACH
jgi:hypothetical protein